MQITSFFALFLFVATLSPSALAANTPYPFIFVHGAFQNASCWDSVRAQLPGITSYAVQLPDHVGSPPNFNSTFKDYVFAVGSLLNQYGPAVLVAHSFGGLVASQATEYWASKVVAVVYVAAYYPINGDTLLGLSGADSNATLGSHLNFIPNPIQPLYLTVTNGSDVFLNNCNNGSTADITKSTAILNVAYELVQALASPLNLSSNFVNVPKYYVQTLLDQAITPGFQAFMFGRSPVRQVFQINTGHSPFVCNPSALAGFLNTISANFTIAPTTPSTASGAGTNTGNTAASTSAPAGSQTSRAGSNVATSVNSATIASFSFSVILLVIIVFIWM